jgi:low affinity Fe/Cu permease
VMQLKLDELIRAVKAARTELVRMEALTDDQLDSLEKEFQVHRDAAASELPSAAHSRQEQNRRNEGHSDTR